MQPIEYKPEKEIKVTKNERGIVNYIPLLLQLSSDRNRQKSIVESLKMELSEKRKCLVITRFIDQSIKLKETLESESKELSCVFLHLGSEPFRRDEIEEKDYDKANVVIMTFATFQSMKICQNFETIVITLPITRSLPSFFLGKRILYVNDTQPVIKRLWSRFISHYFSLWRQLSKSEISPFKKVEKLRPISDVKDS